MCVVCRQRFFKDELLRFVCPVHGELTLTADSTGKLPGRAFIFAAMRRAGTDSSDSRLAEEMQGGWECPLDCA
jgi:predicted RNA-binding protein YlxR (DUF448 family)